MKVKSIMDQVTCHKSIFLLLVLFFSCEILFAQKEIKLDSRDKYIDLAIEQFEANDWEGGKATVDEGLKKYRNDSELNMLAGKYYHHNKNNDKARYHLLKSLEINPKNVDAKQILVNVETESKRYSSAICYVNELLEINPYWRGLWRKKIELYKYQNNYVEARRLQEKINQIYPEDKAIRSDYLYGLEMESNEKIKSGNIDEAIDIYKDLIKSDPNNPNHYINIANAYLKNGDQNSALIAVEQGLYKFPNNQELINKKVGILSDKQQYSILLPFLQEKGLTHQYNYYLLEAARHSKNAQPYTFYSKVFDNNPSNVEAFNYVFNHEISEKQYEEALITLNKHRKAVGNSKDLYAKELRVYNLMGNESKKAALIKKLIIIYPNDPDIQAEYVSISLEEAKVQMANKQHADAIESWYKVLQYTDDEELAYTAQNAIYNSYFQLNEYDDALNILSEMIFAYPNDQSLYLKRAEVYFAQNKYHNALNAYEHALSMKKESDFNKRRMLDGYGEMAGKIVKDLSDNYRYSEALDYTDRWLEQDSTNNLALHYAVNLSHQLKNYDKMLYYAKKGHEAHPDDIFFIVKIAEIRGLNENEYAEVFETLTNELNANPYNPDLINAYSDITENYARYLIKNKQSQEAIDKLDMALQYSPNNNSLKYTKGLAYEKLGEYDSAYYYQAFYEPSIEERDQFNQYLNYLYSKSLKNEMGIEHLRSRLGDDYSINTISSAEYSRIIRKSTLTARVSYAGRKDGKGYQLQGRWYKTWNEKTATNIDAAWADRFFPRFVINGSIYRYIENLRDIQIELGLGYRDLDTTYALAEIQKTDMINFVIGLGKDYEKVGWNIRLNNFWLDSEWLYNVTFSGKYYLSTPKSYIIAMTGFGTSPDIELIDYQYFNSFADMNTMVAAGFSHLIDKNVTFGVLGSWHNYKIGNKNYNNLYNIILNLHVSF